MGAVACTWTLVAMFLCGTSHAYLNNVRSTSFPTPRYDSCRETIEDLKSLLEITQSLKPDTIYTCPTCSSALSEELIIKLVNALIFTATHHCGFNGKGCGGIPYNYGGGTGGNTGGIGGDGNTGNVVGGGNNVIAGGGGTVNGGNNYGGGVTDGSGSNPGGTANPGGSGVSDPLLGVHLLDGNSLAGVNIGSHPILGLDVGSHPGSGSNGAQPDGAVPATTSPSSDSKPLIGISLLKGNEVVGASLGDKKLAEVDLGTSHNNGGTTGVKPNPTPTVSPGSTTNGLLGGDNEGLGGVIQGVLGDSSPATPGTLVPAPSSGSGVTSPVSGIVPDGLNLNNSPTSISTATSQVAGVPVAGGATSPGTGATAPVIDSGKSSIVQNSTHTVNVINQPKS